jgi:hypothetical protein
LDSAVSRYLERFREGRREKETKVLGEDKRRSVDEKFGSRCEYQTVRYRFSVDLNILSLAPIFKPDTQRA